MFFNFFESIGRYFQSDKGVSQEEETDRKREEEQEEYLLEDQREEDKEEYWGGWSEELREEDLEGGEAGIEEDSPGGEDLEERVESSEDKSSGKSWWKKGRDALLCFSLGLNLLLGSQFLQNINKKKRATANRTRTTYTAERGVENKKKRKDIERFLAEQDRLNKRKIEKKKKEKEEKNRRNAGSLEHKIEKEKKEVGVEKRIELEKDFQKSIEVPEHGEVPILMYHHFSEGGGGRYVRSYDQLRSDLHVLEERGFYMVKLSDLYNGGLKKVPAGKKPIALTFDDAGKGQFYLKEADKNTDGEDLVSENYEISESAVKILEEFKEEHPEMGEGATFFVDFSGPIFHQPGLEDEKLQWLVNHGYEVGGHTNSHINMEKSSYKRIVQDNERFKKKMKGLLPNYDIDTFCYPYGAVPGREKVQNYLEGEYDVRCRAWGGRAEVEDGVASSEAPPRIEITGNNLRRYALAGGDFYKNSVNERKPESVIAENRRSAKQSIEEEQDKKEEKKNSRRKLSEEYKEFKEKWKNRVEGKKTLNNKGEAGKREPRSIERTVLDQPFVKDRGFREYKVQEEPKIGGSDDLDDEDTKKTEEKEEDIERLPVGENINYLSPEETVIPEISYSKDYNKGLEELVECKNRNPRYGLERLAGRAETGVDSAEELEESYKTYLEGYRRGEFDEKISRYDNNILTENLKGEMIDRYVNSENTVEEESRDLTEEYGMNISSSTLSRKCRGWLGVESREKARDSIDEVVNFIKPYSFTSDYERKNNQFQKVKA